MGGQEDFERWQIDFAVGVQAAEHPLELAHGRMAVEDLDLGDQPVQPQAHRRVGDTVGLGQFFEGARNEEEPLQKSEVLVVESVDPALGSHC